MEIGVKIECAEVQAEEIEGDLGSQSFDPPPLALLEITVCILQITGVDK